MKAGRKWAAALCVAAMCAAVARADETTKREKLHEMFRLAHIDQSVNLMFAQQQKQFPKLMQQMMPGAKLTPAQQADLNAFVVKLQGIVQQQANWPKLEPQFTDIYASVYSEQEIDGLLAFYKSPVGAEMVAKQPEIVERSQVITQAVMQQALPQIMQAVTEFVQQEKAKYPAGPGTAK